MIGLATGQHDTRDHLQEKRPPHGPHIGRVFCPRMADQPGIQPGHPVVPQSGQRFPDRMTPAMPRYQLRRVRHQFLADGRQSHAFQRRAGQRQGRVSQGAVAPIVAPGHKVVVQAGQDGIEVPPQINDCVVQVDDGPITLHQRRAEVARNGDGPAGHGGIVGQVRRRLFRRLRGPPRGEVGMTPARRQHGIQDRPNGRPLAGVVVGSVPLVFGDMVVIAAPAVRPFVPEFVAPFRPACFIEDVPGNLEPRQIGSEFGFPHVQRQGHHGIAQDGQGQARRLRCPRRSLSQGAGLHGQGIGPRGRIDKGQGA